MNNFIMLNRQQYYNVFIKILLFCLSKEKSLVASHSNLILWDCGEQHWKLSYRCTDIWNGFFVIVKELNYIKANRKSLKTGSLKDNLVFRLLIMIRKPSIYVWYHYGYKHIIRNCACKYSVLWVIDNLTMHGQFLLMIKFVFIKIKKNFGMPYMMIKIELYVY